MSKALVIGLAAAMVLGLAAGSWASHNFTDVPTAATYHSAVEWVVNRGVTLGCAAGLFCPDAVVTRASMALFMQRLGTALTPDFLQADGTPVVIDIDAFVRPVVCATADFTPTFPRRALVQVWVSLTGQGAFGANLSPTYSTDGGLNWVTLGDVDSVVSAVGFFGEWGHGNQAAVVDLVPGVRYRFGAQLSRASGTIDPSSGRCETTVMIVNRNPTTTPLGGPARGATTRP